MNRTELEILQDTCLMDDHSVMFRFNEGRGYGRAVIPHERFQEFIDILTLFEQTSEDQAEDSTLKTYSDLLTYERRTIHGTNNMSWFEVVYRPYPFPLCARDIPSKLCVRIHTTLGKGSKPLYVELENFSEVLRALVKLNEGVVKPMLELKAAMSC